MADAEWELALEKRIEQADDENQKDLDPLEGRLRVVEQWMAAEQAVSTFRRWALPVLVSIAVTFLNIGINVAKFKH